MKDSNLKDWSIEVLQFEKQKKKKDEEKWMQIERHVGHY